MLRHNEFERWTFSQLNDQLEGMVDSIPKKLLSTPEQPDTEEDKNLIKPPPELVVDDLC
jgi:hypothetical protein